MKKLSSKNRSIDLLSGQHMTESYKKINPTQKVPALQDGEVNIFDSNAIAIYLVDKYAKDDSLYPKDLVLRAKVNEKLFYIASSIFPRGYDIIISGMMKSATEIPKDKIDDMLRVYATIEHILKENSYFAGETLTLCDISLWCMMESGCQLLPIDEKRFPNFIKWLNKMREENPFYELNKKGADEHISIYNQCVQMNIAKAAEKK